MLVRREGHGQLGVRARGTDEGALRSPFNPRALPSPALQVEPGREGQADGHRSRARVRHRADVPASSARLSGEVASLQLIVSDFVMPRGLLSKSPPSSPCGRLPFICRIMLFYIFTLGRGRCICIHHGVISSRKRHKIRLPSQAGGDGVACTWWASLQPCREPV